MIEKIKNTYRRRHEIQANLILNGFKQVMLDECGSVSVSKIGQEAIGVLVLVVIFAIIPMVGDIITRNLAISDVPGINGTKVASPWASSPSGLSLWNQTAPILQAAIIIVIVGLILKVIYDLRVGNEY